MAIRKFIVAAALAAIATPAAAAPIAATKDATGKALILIPLTLTKIDDLDFGTVISSSTSGTVSIPAAGGARTATGGVTMVPSDSGARGFFAGAGSAGEQVRIFLAPPGSLTDGAGHSMTIAMNTDATTLTIDSSRAFSLGVGGTVTVGANQADGIYTGTFTVLAQYN